MMHVMEMQKELAESMQKNNLNEINHLGGRSRDFVNHFKSITENISLTRLI